MAIIDCLGDFITEYINSKPEMFFLVWERGKGYYSANDTCTMFPRDIIMAPDLDKIRAFVYKDDLEQYDLFKATLDKALDGYEEEHYRAESKFCHKMRFLTPDGYAYFNVQLFVQRDRETAIINNLIFFFEKLNALESYHARIVSEFTSDRNPALIHKQAKEMIVANPDKKFTVIQFDILRFKIFTQQYGEQEASDLLKHISSTLSGICNSNQVYVRLTADVFMIVTPYQDDDDIVRFIEILDEKLLGYKDMSYKLVYGVCHIDNIDDGLRTYGDRAAMARQSVKGNALHHVEFYHEELSDDLSTKKRIEDVMERALKNDEFKIYLQPKCNISDGSLIGAEALVRWVDPERGIIPPMEFLPVFEENGFIVKMDAYVWEQAAKTIREWMDAGKKPVPISVNISRKDLMNDGYVEYIDGLIEKYQIPRELLELEITETAEGDKDICEKISKLKEQGYTLLMDDFGSGYSSLNTLKDTQFDIIKIDQGFLRNFIDTSRGQKIVEHTIRMTREIGLDLVAEGVETAEQASFLQNCGCTVAQGYYYDRPMPIGSFDEKYMK